MIFGLAILATAVLLSCVAAYYSVAGLTAIFSAATIPVIIMGGSLELGKIVATVWLHNNWKRAGFLFKAYLVPAVMFLMLLTSMGIFGYLSKAHSDQSLVSGDSIAKVAIYDEKIKTEKENIDANRKALKQFDEAVDQVMGRSTDEKGADKAVAIRRSQQKERSRLLAEISENQKRIATLNEERAPLAAEFRKVEAEVGPIKYIAALVYGDNPDANVLEKAVRLVIIMIVLVFDPLALTLILAANKQFEWALHGRGGWVHDEPKYEPDDGPLTAEQVDQIKETVPGPEPSIFEKHPYLLNPFVHFTGLPIVASNKIDVVATTPPIPDNVLDVYNDERLVSKFDKMDLERPGDYVTPPPAWEEAVIESDDEDDEDPHTKEAIRKWKAENPEDTLKHQRRLLEQGYIDQLPWLDTTTGFGPQVPDSPNRGDTFVLTSVIPNRLYKFNGAEWIVVDKSIADNYTYDTAYINHLISQIETGEYDPELLSDSEREQVAEQLTQHGKV